MTNYRRFLTELHQDLVEMLSDCENREWHHANPGAFEFQHYLRLSTWITEVETRMRIYDDTKTKGAWKRLRKSTAPGDVLGRHDSSDKRSS